MLFFFLKGELNLTGENVLQNKTIEKISSAGDLTLKKIKLKYLNNMGALNVTDSKFETIEQSGSCTMHHSNGATLNVSGEVNIHDSTVKSLNVMGFAKIQKSKVDFIEYHGTEIHLDHSTIKKLVVKKEMNPTTVYVSNKSSIQEIILEDPRAKVVCDKTSKIKKTLNG